ncbi:MAG: hypothetical protein J6A10_05020 [Peptococcaceae bacterium]|nr:hypothetical protein [Peptococcaceae bacterium]MBO5365598.1 hypothetical protein [Peptococcaceae bacterium]MBO5429309.1 hypothetical protein [Peptococcaceae bacterium]MBP3585620.1 hypothetical protein [Peptococcaceae bacterium]
MGFLLCIQVVLLLLFWYYCFRHKKWNNGWIAKITLFIAPFVLGYLFVWMDLHLFPIENLRLWHDELCCFSTLSALLLLPQWYKLMWLFLMHLPVQGISEHARLICIVIFSCVMVVAIIFFFALYFLWIDSMSGYTQGLRSALLNYQPILLDFPAAFFFSFCCYFCLGFGIYYPYGFWFYLLMFLECLIALLNNGIVLVYAFQFLFRKMK